MNEVLRKVVENLLNERLSNDMPEFALYEALGIGSTNEVSLGAAVLEVLETKAYVQPNELQFSIDSINRIVDYGVQKRLDFRYNFDSILESYVISQIGKLLKVDLIEWM